MQIYYLDNSGGAVISDHLKCSFCKVSPICKMSITCIFLLVLLLVLSGCGKTSTGIKIGVSFGVGAAIRWESEKKYMEDYAQELGIKIEVRLNKTDEPKTQLQDCQELIDNGIDVLILTPRDAHNASDILEYARDKDVPVINYDRVVLGEKVDLFVGYDSTRVGHDIGQFLSELVYKGDYIILRGDSGDYNSTLQYNGAMRYLNNIKDSINIILDAEVPHWSPEEAKKMVMDAITKNGNHVDAILAPNDKIAGACAEALAELNITSPVPITGMDAELDAAKRIAEETQSMTVYMDLKGLAHTAVDEACHIARGEKPEVNGGFDNQSGTNIDAHLITGHIVTKENLDRILIDSGVYTRKEVYSK